MDKQRFSNLLKDPSNVTNSDIKALNEYRKKYPYFQSLYVVVAKALKERNHPKTEAFIKKAAIYSVNRSHLKNIIEGDFPLIEKTEAKSKESEKKTVDLQNSQPKIQVEVKKGEKKVEPKQEKTQNFKKAQTEQKPDPTKAQAPKKQEAVKNSEEKTEPKQEKAQAIKHVQTEQKPDSSSAQTPIKEKAPEKQKISAQPHSSASEEKVSAKDEPKKALVKEETPQKTKEQKESVIAQYDIRKDLAEIEATKKRIEALLAGELPETSKQTKRNTNPSTKKNKQIEIIEKFIQEEPRIDRLSIAEAESNTGLVDLANKSMRGEESFETETLAQLMAQQGKLKKAEAIYKKLSLKYPEKSTYFATQIQKLKTK